MAKGRPRKGSLVYTKTGWCARIPVTVDGERIKKWYPLGTQSRPVARRKLAKLLDQIAAGEVPTVDQAAAIDTFGALAERVHRQREADGVKSVADERSRVRRYALPELASLAVDKITAAHINEVLDACKAAGRGKQTVIHLKQDIANILDVAKREGGIATNPASDAELPKFKKTVRKVRAVLTDEELARYLAWVHPDERFQMAVLERQTMACVARMFGGLRTGDLHALRWESLDTADGHFRHGWAPRQKTATPQALEIPGMLRPIIRDWWERHGRPTTGPIFPSRRGRRASEAAKRGGTVAKGKTSHAEAMRTDLRRVFGVDELMIKETTRSNGRRLTRQVWQPVRELTPRERELFEEGPYTLPVDFHSWRRAFSQALADADVNVQQATALAGHASLEAHQRYLQSATKVRKLPEAALPNLDTAIVQNRALRSRIQVGVAGFEPATSGTQSGTDEFSGSFSAPNTLQASSADPPNDTVRGVIVQKHCPKSDWLLNAVLAERLLAAALRGMADRMAQQDWAPS